MVWPSHSDGPWKQLIQFVAFTGPSPTGPPTKLCVKLTIERIPLLITVRANFACKDVLIGHFAMTNWMIGTRGAVAVNVAAALAMIAITLSIVDRRRTRLPDLTFTADDHVPEIF